jgi:hypothetical protein
LLIDVDDVKKEDNNRDKIGKLREIKTNRQDKSTTPTLRSFFFTSFAGLGDLQVSPSSSIREHVDKQCMEDSRVK